ncbi:Hypothetical predicted protein [Olea europaea subsp. europaea]|uniref:DNA2/NAM7 helicase-like C-terminal domain-containing protein n=1 Tax=Olea europaea subsp. europaea TaxID=158383 RepID=A0A8S0SYV5_OLEEU|nr:Hypothetical predicted protein [Olea europaea subsp. europaea]
MNYTNSWNKSKEKLSIGVTSPYAAQVVAIQDKLRLENHEKVSVTVKSIDGFQGGEEDIIVVSTVRSNNDGSIGFLSSPQNTNVALTRARHCLWILGNERTLMSRNSVWRAIVCDSRDRQCFFSADEDGDLVEAIINVKKDLDQLEDLLHGESIVFKNAMEGNYAAMVAFSDNFRNSFEKLISSHLKKSVMCILLKISIGWRPKRRSVDLMCETSLQIVKHFKVEGYYIVCTIDILKTFQYEQVLKVWDILSSEEIPKFLIRIGSIFNSYTEDFINRCKEKCSNGNLEVPKTWLISDDIFQYKKNHNANFDGDSSSDVDCRSCIENSKVNESLLLMKFYSLSTGIVKHLLSDKLGRELNLPFEVTNQEKEIILFPRSSFILGRSGTGKTTVLTTRLYRKIQQYCLALDGFRSEERGFSMRNNADDSQSVGEVKGNMLHQLFVTANPLLCFAVKQHLSQLKSFVDGGRFDADISSNVMYDIDEMSRFQDIPDTFVGIQPDMYPLVITFHKFLMMLDGTLGNSFFERFRCLRGFSQEKTSTISVALQTFIRTKEVNYNRFCFFYWPHFNRKLTQSFDPSRVFIGIMSHIKVGFKEGISRADYVALSEKRISTRVQERDAIYNIFEDYEKMKAKRCEFDIADLATNLHFRLRNENLQGDKMDFVYVDEVQDLTMKQMLFSNIFVKVLMKALCFVVTKHRL